MTTWSSQTPTSASWTSTERIEFENVSGTPYGLLLCLTRPYTETDYEDSSFSLVTPNSASWTIQEAN